MKVVINNLLVKITKKWPALDLFERRTWPDKQ